MPLTQKQMIGMVGEWPCWPALPVKNHSIKDEKCPSMPTCGVLLDEPHEDGWTVYDANVWDAESLRRIKFAGTAKWEYATLDDLLAAGWEVD